jgi:prepilin-type N-terminal cleavage/methylation domain-containing protein
MPVSRLRPVSGHDDRDQAGMTLVELLVVIVVSLIVGAVLLGFLDNTTSVVGRATNDIQAENDARLALRSMTQDIRAARPGSISSTSLIPTAGACPTTPTAASCLSFRIRRGTATRPDCQTIVTYGLLAGWVQQTRSDADCASNITISRRLIGNVANGSTPLFTYYNAGGAALSSGQAAATSVKVTLVVTYPGGQQPLTFTSTLSLRNAR